MSAFAPCDLDSGWVRVSAFPTQMPAFGYGGMADTHADDLEERQLLLCDEIIVDTPSGEHDRWHSIDDETWIGSGGASSNASECSPISPNVDELLSYEEERIDGTLNERIISMIERSENLRPKSSHVVAEEACGSTAEFGVDVIRLGGSARRTLVLEILEVCDRYELLPNTAALAVNYLDRFFSLAFASPDIKTQCHAKDLLRSVSYACLSIAIKLEEIVTITPDELQDHVPVGNRVSPATVNEVEDLVLKRLDWRLNATTAVNFLSPFILTLQAMPFWANNPQGPKESRARWAEEHQYLWVQSVKHLTRTLADGGLQQHTEAEKALAAVMCALASDGHALSGWPPEAPLEQAFAYLTIALGSALDGARVYACLAAMQRTSLASGAVLAPLYGRGLREPEPLSPMSVLEGLTPGCTPRASLDEPAPVALGKRKVTESALRD